MLKTNKQIALPVEEPDIPPSRESRTRRQSSYPTAKQPVVPEISAVDFSRRDRELTCLEKDFPIVPVNELSDVEGNAGKSIYQMSKWWARRRSSVFRAILIAAGLSSSGSDDTSPAKRVWDSFYLNHQEIGTFRSLKVLDPFMGGGTTLVEGSRLGYQTYGMDLNPVAWFIVKNEMSQVSAASVRSAFSKLERAARATLSPFYITSCPRGHRGRWIDTSTNRPADVDPLTLTPSERLRYKWEGPEVIYTFWAKHGTCTGDQCGHRTPVMPSPIIATKNLSVQYMNLTCPSCGQAFHAELGEVRMAPGATHVILDSEPVYTTLSQGITESLRRYNSGKKDERFARIVSMLAPLDEEPGLYCPKCGSFAGQSIRIVLERHSKTKRLGDARKADFGICSKTVHMTLLVSPEWLRGASGTLDGLPLGGYAGAPVDSTDKWLRLRCETLELIEVRGIQRASRHPAGSDPGENVGSTDTETGLLPDSITLPDGRVISTRVGTVPLKSTFTCQACGRPNDFLEAVKLTGVTAPVAPYAIQGYCPECDAEGHGYSGRFFKAPDCEDIRRTIAAETEWTKRSQTDLKGFWPEEALPYAWMTHHLNGGLPNWGYTHWWKMFNSRQLLVHSVLLKVIIELQTPLLIREQMLGAFQQYLRNQNMFCFWDLNYDKLVPMMSNPNFHPKASVVENGVFASLGRGNWTSCSEGVVAGLEWSSDPWDLKRVSSGTAKSTKVYPGDSVKSPTEIRCGSATDLSCWPSEFFDLVVTDPPFGDNIFYADLADFFYVWLRIAMLKWYAGKPESRFWEPEASPRTLEAIKNRAEHPDTRSDNEKAKGIPEPAEEFYKSILTASWLEVNRVLKPGGILAFTFHHSAHDPWVSVLESLFDAGFILLATYPIRSDESKGANAAFGARKIEYDILHVCRKREDDPTSVSWAKMRSWVKDEVTQFRSILSLNGSGLTEADIKVILFGKALEFFSRHYNRVHAGDEVLSVRDALIGIDRLLAETGDVGRDIPAAVEPVTGLFLTCFYDHSLMHRDELHKMLRGMPITVDELLSRGWIEETNKVVSVVPITKRFLGLRQKRFEQIRSDLDQAHYLIGAAHPGSSVNILEELTRGVTNLKPTVEDILQWYERRDRDKEVREAAGRALRLVQQWRKTMSSQEPGIHQMPLLEKEEKTS